MAGIPIKFEQMAQQWVGAEHKFAVNVNNFEVRAAQKAKSVFRKSFDMTRFNDVGSSPWQQRSVNSRGSHPLLRETGSLYRSIKWKKKKGGGTMVYTDPKEFRNTKRHKGFCFAAVHNEGLPIKAFGKKHMNMPKRQFIGHSEVLFKELQELIPMLFAGLPQ